MPVSLERRGSIPLGFLDQGSIPINAVLIIPNAPFYHFRVLTFIDPMARMRTVCGCMKLDYWYSKDIVYNSFLWSVAKVYGFLTGMAKPDIVAEFMKRDPLRLGDIMPYTPTGSEALSNVPASTESAIAPATLWAIPVTIYHALRIRRAVSSRASGTQRGPPSTGMKLVSPTQRGTTCPWI